MQTALNHMTVPNLDYMKFLDLASDLGCSGVEVRNDINRTLFDDIEPREAGHIASDKGLRIFGLSQVYPFNDWSRHREDAVKSLIEIAKDSGAETISLIPLNNGQVFETGKRRSNLLSALECVLLLLKDADMVGLVEPLGFQRSSLRSKTELVEMISSIGGNEHLRIVHDTFHHTLADGGPIYPEMTGIVHISGVSDNNLGFMHMEDEHRVLVDTKDRIGNVEQIGALLGAGYRGPISFECFSPEIHNLLNPLTEIKKSFDYISTQIQMHMGI